MHMLKKLLKTDICVLHGCVAAHLFLRQFSREKTNRKMWVGTVKVPQVVKSSGYHAEGMTLPQVASSRRVTKEIVPSLHCGRTHC